MATQKKMLVVKFILSIIIFGLILSIKTIILVNLENIGYSTNEAANIRSIWQSNGLDYIFIVFAVLLSSLIAIKLNVKGD